jgi:hypothetical protein
VSFLGIRQTFPLYEVSLTYDSTRARWTQENHTTRNKIELLYPLGSSSQPCAADRRFDDMRQALEHANPLRARRVKSSQTFRRGVDWPYNVLLRCD